MKTSRKEGIGRGWGEYLKGSEHFNLDSSTESLASVGDPTVLKWNIKKEK